MFQIAHRWFRGKFARRVSALALMAFCVHALIPSGFMPGSVNGQAEIVMCSGHVAHAITTGHSGDLGSQADSVCPFALSDGFAPPAAQLDASLMHAVPAQTAPLIELPIVSRPPSRYTAARGPPTQV